MPRKHIVVKGRVQGVGYRWFARDAAEKCGVRGWVRNLPTGEVEAEAEGSDEALGRFIETLRGGHGWAEVEGLDLRDLPEKGEAGFNIRG